MNKNRPNRREFLGLTGATVAGVASGSLLGTNALAQTENADFDPRHADLVVLNAKVYTIDSRIPRAAFAVKGSRFVFVGSTLRRKRSSGSARRRLTLSR